MGLWNFWMSLHLCGRESIGRKFRVRHLGPAEDGQKWSDHQFRNYGIDIEIRVAALTCIGQREFSKIVDKKSAVVLSVWLDIPSVLLPQTGLKVKSVTSETAELEWTTRWAIVLWSLVSWRLLEEKTRFIWSHIGKSCLFLVQKSSSSNDILKITFLRAFTENSSKVYLN